MLRLRTVVIISIVCFALPVHGDDYVDGLKRKVPSYEAMKGKFAPVYPALARQMVLDYKLQTGVAVEVGSGCGAFALELARQTQMQVYALDPDAPAVRLCGILTDESGLTGRVIPIEGNPMNLPFKDKFADFVFSRGSITSWSDQVQGLKESYRILKPGGVACIGGGFGRLLDPITRKALVEDKLKSEMKTGGPGCAGLVDLYNKVQRAGIKHFRMITEPDIGVWVVMYK